jgi:hypothetical protein
MTLLSGICKGNEDVAFQMVSVLAVDVHKSSIFFKTYFIFDRLSIFVILKRNTKCKGVV